MMRGWGGRGGRATGGERTQGGRDCGSHDSARGWSMSWVGGMTPLGEGAIWDCSNGVMEDQEATACGAVGQTIGPIRREAMGERVTCRRHRGRHGTWCRCLECV
jgi:hypothetical protein